MIYCGDTVFPTDYSEDILKNLDSEFLNREKIVNLESLIHLEESNKSAQGIALISSQDMISFLKNINTVACSQANNHITDFDTSINQQKEFLEGNGIASFGAGDDIETAKKPFLYEENGVEYGVISFGWETISCIGASENSRGVNPLHYESIIAQVEEFFNAYPNKKLIVIFHWNYEFELYPHPAHRQLAFKLIDMGVEAIIGHHPHIVQGYEVYNEKPIFYSLGNFYFPDYNYNGYEMKYEGDARHGLCVDISSETEKMKLYWTYLDGEELTITEAEGLFESEKLKALSPFANMEHKAYIEWFRKNRIKKKGLPIYKNIESKFETTMNDTLTILRQKLIDFLVRRGIKK